LQFKAQFIYVIIFKENIFLRLIVNNKTVQWRLENSVLKMRRAACRSQKWSETKNTKWVL